MEYIYFALQLSKSRFYSQKLINMATAVTSRSRKYRALDGSTGKRQVQVCKPVGNRTLTSRNIDVNFSFFLRDKGFLLNQFNWFE